MAGNSTNRFGGNALLLGGILFTLAVVFHPDVTTLEGAKAANVGVWAFVHWAYLIGDLFLIAGLLTLYRYLAVGANGGWSAVAFAGGMTGFLVDAATTGNHMFSFPPVLAASTPNMQGIFDTVTVVNNGIGGAGVICQYIGLAVLGYVLIKEGWKSPVALGAMAIGVLELLLTIYNSVTGTYPIPAGVPTIVVNALSPLAYAYVGWSFAKSSSA